MEMNRMQYVEEYSVKSGGQGRPAVTCRLRWGWVGNHLFYEEEVEISK